MDHNQVEEEINEQIPEKCEETTSETEPEKEHFHENENGKEVTQEPREDSKVEDGNPVSEPEKIKDTKKKTQMVASQKPRPVTKQNPKAKPTVPRPFSLATDKRMSRERRGASDPSKDPKPILSKSQSLGVGTPPSTRPPRSSSVRTDRSSELKHGASTRTGDGRLAKQTEFGHGAKKQQQGRETAEIHTSSATTKAAEKPEVKNIRKISSFNASPLPGFSHEKNTRGKPELKKIPPTTAKSPLVGHRRSKSMSESGAKREQIITPSTSTNINPKPPSEPKKTETGGPPPESGSRTAETILLPISKSGITQMPEPGSSQKSEAIPTKKSSPKTITGSAKETINRFLRGSWKAPAAKRKESANEGVSGRGKALVV